MDGLAWDSEVCRDRIHRAGEVRDQIGQAWAEYMSAGDPPRKFAITRSAAANQWTFVVNTLVPMPIRLSTLFGEWLYLLRAALDGTAYLLAVRDSAQDPPLNARSIYFPIKDDPAKYDNPNHRANLQALSDETFALLRQIQPFNAQPSHLTNTLWWIEELARIDRHRRGHTLAVHIVNARIGLQPPLRLVKFHLPQSPSKPIPIDESAPMSILDIEAPPAFGEIQIMQHMDIGDALTNILDVSEWRANSIPPMSSVDLSERMIICEDHLLNGIINPLLDGTAGTSTD